MEELVALLRMMLLCLLALISGLVDSFIHWNSMRR